MPFFAGEAIQTLDMNQDGYFEEALKMRNLLREARKRHFSSTLYIFEKINILPRQARDKHRENSKKCRFLAV
jgi:hypothetical protein